MEENIKNPVLTVYDEKSGKYYDITINMDLLKDASLSEEDKKALEALLEAAKEQEV